MTSTSYNTMFDIGYPLRIRGPIIILPVKLITAGLTAGQLPGSLKAKLFITGNRQRPYCGSMVFVGPERPRLWLIADRFRYHSGIRKNRPLVWVITAIYPHTTHDDTVQQSSRISVTCVKLD
jgi:hypothetical protein